MGVVLLAGEAALGAEVGARWLAVRPVALSEETAEDGLAMMNRIREKVAEIGFHFRGTPVSVTVSCGLTSLRAEDGADDAFDRADKAMYQAKDSGRNRVAQL